MRILLPVAAAICLIFPPFYSLSAQTNPAPPTTTVNVREVSLDLTVRDSKGKVVRNLKPEDVQILENGVAQKITDFHFVEGRDTATGPGANAKAAPLRTSNLVCIVFHNVDVHTRKFATDAVAEFVSKELPAGTWVGVFNLGGGLSVLQQFTTDRAVVLQASKRAFVGSNPDFASSAALVNSANPTEMSVSGAGGSQAGSSLGGLNVTGGEINNAAINGADVSTDQSANVARGEAAADRRQFGGMEGLKAFDQMQTMIRQLGGLPGRKTILLLSPGLIATGIDPDKFKSLVTMANADNVSIFAIDTNGMDANSSVIGGINMTHTAAQSGSRTGTGGQDMSMDDSAAVAREGDTLHDAVRGSNAQAPLRMLAEGTGGAFSAGNDLRKPFQRIVDDLGAHYEAVYHPASEVWDGRLRNIEVKTRPGLTVESRKAYFALPDPTSLRSFDAPALVALGTTPPPHAFDFAASAYQFRPQAGGSQYAIAFAVPGTDMTPTALAAQKEHRLHVSLLALVKDSKGEVVNKLSRDYPLYIPDDKLAATQAQTLNASLPFEIGPGHYTVETAVVDFEGRRASTGTLQIDNPERQGVGISSLLLVGALEDLNGKPDPTDPFEYQGKRVVPMTPHTLKPTDQQYVYFVVYPDKASTEKPHIDVEFLVGGETLAKQSAELPEADASGAIPMAVTAALKPGECEFKITAVQGNASSTQSVKYTVADQ